MKILIINFLLIIITCITSIISALWLKLYLRIVKRERSVYSNLTLNIRLWNLNLLFTLNKITYAWSKVHTCRRFKVDVGLCSIWELKTYIMCRNWLMVSAKEMHYLENNIIYILCVPWVLRFLILSKFIFSETTFNTHTFRKVFWYISINPLRK